MHTAALRIFAITLALLSAGLPGHASRCLAQGSAPVRVVAPTVAPPGKYVPPSELVSPYTPSSPNVASKVPYCDWESLIDPACGPCGHCGDGTQPCCGTDWLPIGRFQFAIDVMALTRDPASVVEFAGGHDRPLTTGQTDAPFAAMPRLLASFEIAPTWRIEGLYFGLGEWQEDRAVRDDTPNLLGGNGDLLSRLSNFGRPRVAGLDYLEFASFATESTLDNVELNVRHAFESPDYFVFSGLVGVRYLDIGENVEFLTVSSVPGPLDSINDVQATTSNKLFGVQIGGDLQVPLYGRWSAEFEAKAAILNNRANVDILYTRTESGGVTEAFDSSDTASQTVFLGDLALTFNCQWSPWFATRFGYRAIWLDGLALAPQNIARDADLLRLGPANLDVDGRVVYHGPQAGVTFSW